MVNKEFIVEGIKNLLRRNFSINPETIDVEALVDSKLTYGENVTLIIDYIHKNQASVQKLRCKGCEKILNWDWNYCPNCGDSIE